MSSFESLIHPLSPEVFFDQYWTKQLLHIEGPTQKFHDLMNWDDLNRLLEQNLMSTNRVKLVRNGEVVERKRFERAVHGGRRYINPSGVMVCLSEGATLIVDSVMRPFRRCER